MNASAPLPPQTVLTWKASVWWKSALRNPFRDLLRGLILFWCLGSLFLPLSLSVCMCVSIVCVSQLCAHSVLRCPCETDKESIQCISCASRGACMCVGESGTKRESESERKRLIGILVLCRGGDAREVEIISLVELNLIGQSA